MGWWCRWCPCREREAINRYAVAGTGVSQAWRWVEASRVYRVGQRKATRIHGSLHPMTPNTKFRDRSDTHGQKRGGPTKRRWSLAIIGLLPLLERASLLLHPLSMPATWRFHVPVDCCRASRDTFSSDNEEHAYKHSCIKNCSATLEKGYVGPYRLVATLRPTESITRKFIHRCPPMFYRTTNLLPYLMYLL